MTWPQHRNPRRGEASIAPYNFVPLPDAVLPHPEGWDRARRLHDRYHQDRHTGWIELTLTTETPLYTRCARPPRSPADEQRHFFHHGDPERPVIPGSSVRGAIRTLVEILAYGKLAGEAVLDRQLYYRFLGARQNALKGLYIHKFVERFDYDDGRNGPHPCYRVRVQGGLYRRGADGGHFIEPCDVARVEHRLIRSTFGKGPHTGPSPNGIPDPGLQGARVWVQVQPPTGHFRPRGGPRPPMYLWYAAVSRLEQTHHPGLDEGILVISGPAPRKHMEFVFVPNGGSPVPVPAALVESFEDDDQITQWQERAFPAGAGRRKAGGLRDGEPVFYLTDSAGTVIGFGRAQMFRLPYAHRTSEYLPQELKDPKVLDLPEAIFGTVGGSPEHTVKGRVSFEDAECETEDPFVPGADRFVPRILSSPKPAAFQHYLVQPAGGLCTYETRRDRTVLRGHKLYWHKPGVTVDQIRETDQPGTQHTVIRPVRAGVTFRTRIHFENLSDLELGALLAAIELPPDCRHKLGMGKPLGMGSVRMTAELRLSDREARYRRFADQGTRGEVEAVAARARRAFEEAVIRHVGAPAAGGLWGIPRLQQLRRLLVWDEAPPQECTRYVGLDTATDPAAAQWRERRILPTPDGVTDEPCASTAAGPPGSGAEPVGELARPARDAVERGTRQPRPKKAPSKTLREGAPAAGGARPVDPGVSRAGGPDALAGSAAPPGAAGAYQQDQIVRGVLVVEARGETYTLELPDGSRVDYVGPWANLKVGQRIKVRIIKVDPRTGKVTSVVPR